MRRRLLVVWVASVVLLLVGAPPVLADPATPTNYRSVVNTLDPAPSGVVLTVQGGDAFLNVVVEPGHTVEIPGYFGEPYIRLDEAGDVWRNERSPSRFINIDRYGLAGVPDEADANAEPDWRQVGSGGQHGWHDHRIHWMSRDLPPTVAGDRAEVVFPWTVTISVDGVETEVRGELLWFPSINPLGSLLTGALAVGPLLFWRPGRLEPMPIVAALFGSTTLYVATAQHAATPIADRPTPTAIIVLILATGAAVASMRPGSPSPAAWRALLVTSIGFVWWAWSSLPALTAPILPSAVPSALERAVVAGAMWLGIALGLMALNSWLRLLRASTPASEPSPVLEGSLS